MYVAWKRVGKTLPITTHGYNERTMTRVAPSQMRPGDVLWRTGHVGMFVGNGEVVQAANSNLGVIKSRLANFSYSYVYRPK